MASMQCEFYLYTPSLFLAALAVIFFSGLTAIHYMRMTRAKIWTGVFFVLGGFAQMAGYTARLFSAHDACNRAAYGVQSVLLLLGPTLIMFSVNLTQTEFARALGAEKFCWLSIGVQRTLYISINTVLILLQTIAGIMTVASTSTAIIAVAAKMAIAAYVAQTIFWLFTMVENICMTVRLRRYPTDASMTIFPDWKYWNQLLALAISIIAIGRNIVRLTMDGGIVILLLNEWPSYAFDGYQMVVVLGAWAIWYLPEKCESVTEATSLMSLPNPSTRKDRAQRRHGRIQRRDEISRAGQYYV